MLTTRPRGTLDYLPADMDRWHRVEGLVHHVCRLYGYQQIRTPVFEHSELFERTVGGATDIVEKEMYTFKDRGGRSLSLKPEGTAPAARAFLEDKLYAQSQPTKLYYVEPVFRYERPQAGRVRQHYQFGIEAFGSQNPALDAEIISLAVDYLGRLGVTGLEVTINSIGCPKCRPAYREKLVVYLQSKVELLCEDCRSRLERNPLRVLDCKNEACRPHLEAAPVASEHLCPECAEHFQAVHAYLAGYGIPFRINPRLVRGLDYYTKTVFEIIYPPLGAQSTVCGGGRYDGLIEVLGGDPTPGVGFGMGIERVLLTLEKQGVTPPSQAVLDVFVAAIGQAAAGQAMHVVHHLRAADIAADLDYLGRSLKAQFKYADRTGARWVAIIGDEELAAGQVTLRDLATRKQERVAAADLAARLASVKAEPTVGAVEGEGEAR
ncbi:MAG TPA: histidine--tRNA ligase [Bacillota bacterium]